MKVAFFLDVVGYSVLAVSDSLALLLLGCTIFCVGNSLIRPRLTSLISLESKQSEQGAVLGLTGALNSIGQVVAPPMGGAIIDAGYLTGWGLGLAGLSFLGLWPSASKRTQSSPNVEPPPVLS